MAITTLQPWSIPLSDIIQAATAHDAKSDDPYPSWLTDSRDAFRSRFGFDPLGPAQYQKVERQPEPPTRSDEIQDILAAHRAASEARREEQAFYDARSDGRKIEPKPGELSEFEFHKLTQEAYALGQAEAEAQEAAARAEFADLSLDEIKARIHDFGVEDATEAEIAAVRDRQSAQEALSAAHIARNHREREQRELTDRLGKRVELPMFPGELTEEEYDALAARAREDKPATRTLDEAKAALREVPLPWVAPEPVAS